MTEPKTPSLQFERMIATDDFIANNNFKLRTQAEVVERYKATRENDILGFQADVLLDYMTLDSAEPFIKPEAVAAFRSGEKKWGMVTDIKECAQDFLDYMNFAWTKALDERGISASRSVEKLGEWLWLMNREDLSQLIHQDDLYNPYGAPALIEVCKKLNIGYPNELEIFSQQKV